MCRSPLFPMMIVGFLSACGESSDAINSSEFTKTCSATNENRQVIRELRRNYLWNDELPSHIDPSAYASSTELLNDILPPRDPFSFTMTRQQYEDRYINQSFFGYGFGTLNDIEAGVLRIRYVFDYSPADRAGITRGSEITALNGTPMSEWYNRIAQGEITFNEIFGGDEEGVELAVEWRRVDGQMDNAILRKTEVETNTVMAIERLVEEEKEIGYFVFDSFINRSDQDVNAAYDAFIGVDELVIDLRYNGGGLIRIANQIASQAAWHAVENEIFATYQFNSNYRNDDILFNLGSGIERLNLDRVVVLTTGASCSSSELVINALTPFVEVVTVGAPTCGKPVGQYPVEICDNILFAVNFQMVNAEGFGDYFDGIQPTCFAPDTVQADWADPADPMLGEALHYLTHGSCSGQFETQDSAVALTLDSSSSVLSRGNWLHSKPTPLIRNPLLDKWDAQH